MSILMSDWTNFAATARNVPGARAAWREDGRRRPHLLPPPCGGGSEGAELRQSPDQAKAIRAGLTPPPVSCWPLPIRTASRATAARTASSWPMVAARPSTRRSALARPPYIAVAELTGTAAQGRILLAAPIALAEIEAHFADQIESADEISFDRGAMALRARRKRTLHAIRCRNRRWRCAFGRDRAGPSRRTDRCRRRKLPWSKALKTVARSRHVPA